MSNEVKYIRLNERAGVLKRWICDTTLMIAIRKWIYRDRLS